MYFTVYKSWYVDQAPSSPYRHYSFTLKLLLIRIQYNVLILLGIVNVKQRGSVCILLGFYVAREQT